MGPSAAEGEKFGYLNKKCVIYGFGFKHSFPTKPSFVMGQESFVLTVGVVNHQFFVAVTRRQQLLANGEPGFASKFPKICTLWSGQGKIVPVPCEIREQVWDQRALCAQPSCHCWGKTG